jgi:hypothetical protein
MKDYKILFGYAAVLLSIGFVIRSITFAYAYPTGPNVSMGSNPQFSFYSTNCSSDEEVVTVDSDRILVITNIVSGSIASDDTIILKTITENILGQFFVDYYQAAAITPAIGKTINNPQTYLSDGIVVSAGETLVISCNSDRVTITGHYEHP